MSSDGEVEDRAGGAGARFGRRLGALCALGLALRLAAVLTVPTAPISDFWSYRERALNLLDTGVYGVRAGRPDATWPPGYPLALAAVFAVGGRGLFVAKLLNVGLGVAAVAAAGLLGRRLWGERAGLASGALAAVHPRLVLLPCLLASENLFLPLSMLVLLALAASWERPTDRAALGLALLGGLLLGCLTLARSVGYLLVLLWPASALAARRGWRKAVVETLAVLLALHAVLLPWALRNHRSLGAFSFLTGAAGQTLFIGNNPNATGRWYDAWADAAPYRRPGGERGFAVSRRMRDAALDWIRAHPRRAAALYLRKVRGMFDADRSIVELAVTHAAPAHRLQRRATGIATVQALPDDHPLRRNPAPLLGIVAAGFWATAVLSVAGCLLLVLRARRGDARAAAAAVAFAGAALSLVLVSALFLGEPRFRWPASDALLPVAGLALAAAFGRAAGRGAPTPPR